MSESTTHQPSGAARIVGALLGIASFVTGLYVMSLAFDGRDSAAGWFVGGLALIALPFMIGLNLKDPDKGSTPTGLTQNSDAS